MSNVADADNKLPQGEAYHEKYGIPRITIKEARWNIELSLQCNQLRGCLAFISEAGEGKSQMVHQVADAYDCRVCDVRTSQLALIGVGVPQRANEETGQFKIAVPEDYPKPGEKAILLFDEFNQGLPHAISMVFRLLEDRGLYNYKLPDDCLVIHMMNPSTANYQVSKIETNPAINRRLKKFYLYTPYSQWREHAGSNAFHASDGLQKPCHPAILSFLDTEPNRLYTIKDRDVYKQFACPATYQTASLDLYNMESKGEDITSERAENRLASTLNTVNARAILDYARNNQVRISPSEVLTAYKPKSALRERILAMKTQSGGDYPKLIEVVAHHIFSECPSPRKIAAQLLLFWDDMPAELSQGFYQQLATAATKDGAEDSAKSIKYMAELTELLQVDPVWDRINERINDAHDSFEKSLHGGKTSPDPMPTKAKR